MGQWVRGQRSGESRVGGRPMARCWGEMYHATVVAACQTAERRVSCEIERRAFKVEQWRTYECCAAIWPRG